MNAPVLVLAARDDWPTDRIVTELTQRGTPVLRMDTADFPQRLTVGARIDQGHGWAGELATEHHAVELSQVGAVYYRAPGAFQFPAEMSAPERMFAAGQARAGLGGVLSALSCPRWLNHPTSAARAEYKPVQLAAAREAGLLIPPTLVTNRPEDVRQFAAETGPLICKPLASPVVIEGGELKTVYTRLLSDEDLTDLRGISVTAHLFQAWIEKTHEIRLTVVGERMFAAAIHAGSDAAHIDWRSDYGSLTYTPTEVSGDVAAGVRRLMDSLGLRYGAIDLAVDQQGRVWFLEVNPTGQFDWIQGATGLPIVEAIADELEGK